MIENNDQPQTITSLKERIQQLETSIKDIDANSQEGLSNISVLTRMAEILLKSVDKTSGEISDAIQALIIIRTKAGELENCINSQAELLGCNWVEGRE
ncbi:hypothetical protein QYM36_019559 [Artemia franciscana]|uniref:Uncharacterized protein n=1 Tax=Artemia franciscana TaxID=6661 RepID=A0AA88KTQ9_ARTSF|nr:hypothetical protein QYM36_019559 [Artemia franciscana]